MGIGMIQALVYVLSFMQLLTWTVEWIEQDRGQLSR